MRSHSFFLNSPYPPPPPPPQPSRRFSSSHSSPPLLRCFTGASFTHQIPCLVAQKHRRHLQRRQAFDDGSFDIPSLDGWSDNEGTSGYVMSSSDGENSDGELVLNPASDMDLPPNVKVSTNDALTMTAHRFAMIGRRRKRRRIKYGALINVALIGFLTICLLLVDCCAWRIVRLPLEPFYLTRPFFISAVLVSCVGYVCVPLLHSLQIFQIIRKKGPRHHFLKRTTPTMGGLFFVPIGVAVAQYIAGFSSVEVTGAAAVTLAYAAIGLLDDSLSLFWNKNNGLSAWLRILLEVAVAISFAMWLDCTSISSPYGMKELLPLPPPFGLICLGKVYTLLTSFCFVSMGNGVNLTDGLDGLAGGTAALAFIAMSVAVLPICTELAVFGASMAGACVGFLLHNRYRASIFMGDTGSLALGGALAAMASCTGMFFPLFISSGVFVIEALSVILQVSYLKATKQLLGSGLSVIQMAPFHHHLELYGMKEPAIVAAAYVISAFLSIFAAYVGLISA